MLDILLENRKFEWAMQIQITIQYTEKYFNELDNNVLSLNIKKKNA